MTPEQFLEQIRQALPTGVRSVVLFGSAAAGDHLGKQSDYNVLVVLEQLGLPELTALAPATKAWVKAGNHPPLLFTVASLRESGAVFPIELLDMRDANRVLFGEDLLKEIAVSDANLRREVERELLGKRLHLQSQFLRTGGKPAELVELMTATLSNFLVLFRAAARLYRPVVPAKKLAALQVLAEHVTLDVATFVTIQELKEGRRKRREVEPAKLFEQYLRGVDAVTQAVSGLAKGTEQ